MVRRAGFLARCFVFLNKRKILLLTENGCWEAQPAPAAAFYIIPAQCVIKWEGEARKHNYCRGASGL